MFLANTKVGKFCHLCLEHDYTTAFSECQVLSEKIFKCAFHKAFYSNHRMLYKGSLEPPRNAIHSVPSKILVI